MKKIVPLFILLLVCGVFALGGCAPAATTASPTPFITPLLTPAGEPGIAPTPTMTPVTGSPMTTINPGVTITP